MIFNLSQGGVSVLSVTAPSGAAISATCDGLTVTGTGTCTLQLVVIGTWAVSCTVGGVTKTVNVNVSSYGQSLTQFFAEINVTVPGGTVSCEGVSRSGSGKLPVAGTGTKTVSCVYDGVTHTSSVSVNSSSTSYSTSITYSCTISVACPAGASVVASRSGYSNVTRTGSGSITVPKYGNWTVTVTIGSGTGQESKAATVYAEYDTPKSTSLYPKFWIYRTYGDYRGAGLSLFDADGVGAAISYGSSYADYTCSDGGNNVLISTYSVNLTGYTAIKIHCKLVYANRVELGLTASNNMYNSDNWAYRNKIHNLVSPDNRVSWDWATYSINISSTASIHPVLLNLGGGYIPGISQDKDSEVEIDEWWLE